MREDGAAAEVEAPRRRIIKRPRLTRLLDEADARILLLVAPAGYGKTTLAREWVASADRRTAWIAATPAVSDVASLALALRRELRKVIPEFGAGLEEQLRLGPRPTTHAASLGDHLGSQLTAWEPRWWLVVDDYHQFIGEPGVEEFFDALLTASTAQALITGRVRPTWVTARRLVYGELREFGQQALAMTHEEAGEVLDMRPAKEVPGLVALADGWPALLGLAARAPLADFPTRAIAESFYDFLAEELYNAATPDARGGLVLLSLAPTITEASANALLGSTRARRVLNEAVRLGFVQRDATGFSMHSLISEFLSKRSQGEDVMHRATSRLGRFLFRSRKLDDLYVLARRFPDDPGLLELANAVIGQILERNEIEGLDRWLDHATAARLETPEVDLAAAERAFREARYEQSELLAERSASRFSPASRLRSRALSRAGLSAYHDNRPEPAVKYHAQALIAALHEDDRLQALWGQISAAFELESDTTELINELERTAACSPLHQIRFANAHLARSYRTGGILDAIGVGRASLAFLDRVHDPMVRSAFLNAYGLALVLNAQYEEAASAVERELKIIHEYRLNFAVPHALVLKCGALAGRRYFAEAFNVLNQAEKAARRSNDDFSVANLATQRIRLMLFHEDAEGAKNYASKITIPPILPSLTGEYMSAYSLACAATGEIHKARQLLGESRRVTKSIETREWARWAEVIIASQAGPEHSSQLAAEAFDRSWQSGCLHSVVCAYRAYPSLLTALCAKESIRNRIENLVSASRDQTLGRNAGLPIERTEQGNLSPRETEVFQLLGEGLSNRDIARRLFISQATVKVHVRRIFEKLGVRSRTEAALVSAQHFSAASGGLP